MATTPLANIDYSAKSQLDQYRGSSSYGYTWAAGQFVSRALRPYLGQKGLVEVQ